MVRHTRLSSSRIALPELAPLRRDERRRLPRLHRAGPSTSLDKSAVFYCPRCTRVVRVTHTLPCPGGARQLDPGLGCATRKFPGAEGGTLPRGGGALTPPQSPLGGDPWTEQTCPAPSYKRCKLWWGRRWKRSSRRC